MKNNIPICSGARQHLVDAENVVGVHANSHVERVLTGCLEQVLVRADAAGLQRLGGELLMLAGDQVDTQGELIDVRALATQIEDADLGIGNTSHVPRLRVRLVLAIAVAASGA
jgi:hypothetical protein